jgi:hypothetical protein
VDRLSVSVPDSSQEFIVQDLQVTRLISGSFVRHHRFSTCHLRMISEEQIEITQSMYISAMIMRMLSVKVSGRSSLQRSLQYSHVRSVRHGLLRIQA